ncbi:MAG: SCO1664 family protein [Anaerolineales bacterium]
MEKESGTRKPGGIPTGVIPKPETAEILRRGRIELTGQFVWGSNSTFLARVIDSAGEVPAVYKPSRGEAPLWDFPEGSLAARETAAYLTSRALGWNLVPPTVLREDGPEGPGSLQLFVEADPERHYFTFTPEEKQRLRPVAVFDLLVNNADRKGGHVLIGEAGQLWLIDHGVCFHSESKLRTVIWDFVGEPIPGPLLQDVSSFQDRLKAGSGPGTIRAELGGLLTPGELNALERRAQRTLDEPCFPSPGRGRPYPWPMV